MPRRETVTVPASGETKEIQTGGNFVVVESYTEEPPDAALLPAIHFDRVNDDGNLVKENVTIPDPDNCQEGRDFSRLFLRGRAGVTQGDTIQLAVYNTEWEDFDLPQGPGTSRRSVLPVSDEVETLVPGGGYTLVQETGTFDRQPDTVVITAISFEDEDASGNLTLERITLSRTSTGPDTRMANISVPLDDYATFTEIQGATNNLFPFVISGEAQLELFVANSSGSGVNLKAVLQGYIPK